MNNSVDIVHAFWEQVWNAHDPGAVDRFVVDDFVIGTGGETVTGRENFKKWIEGFLATLVERFEAGPVREVLSDVLERRLALILGG